MQRRGLRLALAALTVLALSTAACDVRGFRIQVPGFETKGVLGVWVWRESPTTGEYERYAQIQFGDRYELYEGIEFLWYSFPAVQGPMHLQTKIEYATEDPDTVNLNLAFLQVPGSFKISSYNASGESPLSAGTLTY
jgi:hypothetical protein